MSASELGPVRVRDATCESARIAGGPWSGCFSGTWPVVVTGVALVSQSSGSVIGSRVHRRNWAMLISPAFHPWSRV